MPEGHPIRNINIEDKHPAFSGEVITRQMTAEERLRYGPPNNRKQSKRPIVRYEKELELAWEKERRSKQSMNRIDKDHLYDLLVKHGTDVNALKQISAETGWSRIDITHLKDYNTLVTKANQERMHSIVSDELSQCEAMPKTIETPLNAEATNNGINELTPQEQPVIPAPVYISAKPNDKAILHKYLCTTLHETYVSKNTAYGDSFSVTFKEFGIISALTRMSDKWNRIKALAAGAKNDVKDESLIDTLMDLANYCTMTVMEIKKEGKHA